VRDSYEKYERGEPGGRQDRYVRSTVRPIGAEKRSREIDERIAARKSWHLAIDESATKTDSRKSFVSVVYIMKGRHVCQNVALEIKLFAVNERKCPRQIEGKRERGNFF